MASKRSTSRPAAPTVVATHTLRDIIAVSRMYPQLWLNVSAKPDGVHLVATLIPPSAVPQPSNRQLVRAVWQPAEVTERLVVEWAYRALRKLLEDDYEGTGGL